ncbi:hypothetical protein BDF21DRAFT_336454 [Thamnidium elegans]|nr:hypothetical protein BDF21DRAFT_336454 [Thamnidium elegans]
MKSQRVCPTCHTKKFRKSTDAGLVCKYGHKLLGVQQEEGEEAFSVAKGSRRKIVRETHGDNTESNPAQQRSDFLLVVQFGLQVISRSMVQDLNFPPELEPTVRELWLLYVADSKKEVIDSYMFEAFEKEANDKMRGSNTRNDIGIFEEEEKLLESFRDDDEDYDSDSENEGSAPRGRPVRLKWQPLKFYHILVFIYYACMYLRYPILPNDLVRWCRSGDIPYLKIQERIPSQLLSSLSLVLSHSMNNIPSPAQIRKAEYSMARCFEINCNLELPDINVPLYMDRFCAQFFLPVEGYYFAQCIWNMFRSARVLNLKDSRMATKIPATVFLMACVLTAVKFMYAIGDTSRDTLSSVSEFDKNITKENYMKKIKQNIEEWKKVYQQQEDLGNIIQNLKDTSIANKLTLLLRQKNLVMLRALESIHQRSGNYSKRSSSSNLFMDTTVWDKTDYNVAQTEATVIELGSHYFVKRTAISPKDYLDILELATLVSGELSNSTLEVALQKVERIIASRCGYSTTKKNTFNKAFKPIIP